MSKEFKIGIVVLSGILLLFGAYIFFHTITFKSQTYEIKAVFKNLEKMDTGAIVRLSGFKIGNVTEIKLTEESFVLVKMRIDKNIKIPKDSFCTATTGAVIGEMFIKITPGDKKVYMKDGDTIQAVSKANFDDLTKGVNELISVANSSMLKVNDILDSKDHIIKTVENLEKITAQVEKMSKGLDSIIVDMKTVSGNIIDISEKTKQNIIISTENVRDITANALDISDQIDVFLKKDALPQVKDLLQNANFTLKNLNETINYSKELMINLNDATGNVSSLISDADKVMIKSQVTMDKIDTLLVTLNDTTSSANSVIKKVDDFLADQDNVQNVKDIIKNIKETSEQANQLMRKFNNMVGTNGSAKSLISADAVSENMYNKHDKKFRSDFYTDVFFGNNGVKLGINDIGERNKGIIQYQRKFNDYNYGKIGLFNSKLGLGYEYKDKKFSASFDWYNPNRSELYIRSKYKLTPNFGIFAGVDDVIQKDNRNFLFGVSLEK